MTDEQRRWEKNIEYAHVYGQVLTPGIMATHCKHYHFKPQMCCKVCESTNRVVVPFSEIR